MSFLEQLFSMGVSYLPGVFVCLVALVVVLAKWRLAPRASAWALAGFGLLLLSSIAMPVAQVAVHRWAMGDGVQEERLWALGTLSVAGALLHCVVLVLLLVAVYAGRGRAGLGAP